MTILQACADPKLFAPFFADTQWSSWRVFLATLYALPLAGDDGVTYATHTGRFLLPTAPAREAWVVVGRRGGKSRIAALVAVYIACFLDHRSHLAPGEIATVAVIAADRRQARVVLRYIRALISAVPMLRPLIVTETRESIELSNGVAIEVHTASFRLTRGYTLAAVIADEIAFWRTDDAAEPDTEIISGLRPGLATIPGGLLLCISSPYARKGALFQAFRDHYAKDGDPVLVWRAPTAAMNPTVPADVIAAAYAADPSAAAAEYGAEFRTDVESYVDREVLEGCVIPGRRELPPAEGLRYFAFVDPSGGTADSMTLAIAHRDDRVIVLDALRERRPPFSPDAVVEDFAALLKTYHCHTVTGDRYAAEWPRERFRVHGVEYRVAEKTKSELYRDLLPLVNATRVELLDHPKSIAQLGALERRTSRAGKDAIDHPPGAHDDVANAVAGVCAVVNASVVALVAPRGPVRESPWRAIGARRGAF